MFCGPNPRISQFCSFFFITQPLQNSQGPEKVKYFQSPGAGPGVCIQGTLPPCHAGVSASTEQCKADPGSPIPTPIHQPCGFQGALHTLGSSPHLSGAESRGGTQEAVCHHSPLQAFPTGPSPRHRLDPLQTAQSEQPMKNTHLPNSPRPRARHKGEARRARPFHGRPAARATLLAAGHLQCAAHCPSEDVTSLLPPFHRASEASAQFKRLFTAMLAF